MAEYRLEMKGICKSFPGVKALDGINLRVRPGTVHALMGENGAGKSTLMKCLFGIYKMDEGEIYLDGEKMTILNPDDALHKGLAMVHQELQILPLMNVEENIFIGEESSRRGFVNKKEMRKRSLELLEMVGLNAQPETKVAEIEIAGRQLLEIARAINHNARIIILDEPTSSLSQAEIRKFFTIIKKLKEQGVSFIFISHRLEEVFELADKIIVLKDGEKVAELNTEETNEKEVIRLMVGREYSDFYQRERKCHGDVCLELKDISGVKEGMLNNAYIPQHVSLKVEEGEVLGIAGLVGAGRTELVRMIFGEMPIGSGEIFVQGEKVQIKSSRDAIKLGMAWVTEDRKQEGLILEDTLVRNLSLPTVHKHRKAGIIDDNFLTKMSEKYIQKLKVKTTGGLQKAKNLSGGNQQKIVLGKWLSTNPKILILDEPTRGIDVGAKAEIYKLINELTAQGMAIVLISSELPEVMGMSDRLLIMYEGRVTGQLLKEEYTEERVMEYATGRKVHNE